MRKFISVQSQSHKSVSAKIQALTVDFKTKQQNETTTTPGKQE
jgi:hypothetical protein